MEGIKTLCMKPAVYATNAILLSDLTTSTASDSNFTDDSEFVVTSDCNQCSNIRNPLTQKMVGAVRFELTTF